MPQRTLCAYIIALVFFTASWVGCRASRALSPDAGRGAASQAASGHITKQVSFSILEDYDKGEDLDEVAEDFALMQELDVTTWRGSFGWDDYEPARGKYDFTWLHDFAELAKRVGIELRPYIGYTPAWAARGGGDAAAWNDPPKRIDDWYDFVYNLASAMRRHRNIRSFEIYNEENVRLWWDGTTAEYNQVLLRGAAAIREANPGMEVLLGGLVFPDVEFIKETCAAFDNAGSFDIVPLHAYPETWTPETVTVENYLDAQYRTFTDTVKTDCQNEPIWINEAGFATAAGKTERDQANWWARAIATFLAAPEVEHIGIYEIKDLKPEREIIGEGRNYFLGLTDPDRKKKLAFHTVDLLTDLLDVSPLTVADADLTVTVTEGKAGALYHHLFIRPGGEQILFVWDKRGRPTVNLQVRQRGAAATEYALDGSSSTYPEFDGKTLRNVRLTPGEVRIFEIGAQ